MLELLDDIFVDGSTEVLDAALSATQHNGRGIVGSLTSWTGVADTISFRLPTRRRSNSSHSDQIQLVPHGLHELVDIEPLLRGNGHRVGDLH